LARLALTLIRERVKQVPKQHRGSIPGIESASASSGSDVTAGVSYTKLCPNSCSGLPLTAAWANRTGATCGRPRFDHPQVYFQFLEPRSGFLSRN
jgi:hypothetical protein